MASITGWSGSPAYFTAVEYPGFRPAAVASVLRGDRAMAVFRGAFPAASSLVARFRDHPAVVRRDDDAAGRYLGAYHYLKPTEQYLKESAEARPAVEEVLCFDGSPWREFLDGLTEYYRAAGITVRPARGPHSGAEACPGVARSWEQGTDFALVPHEDASQCRHPGQAGFEIQAVLAHQVCAVNLCLENEGGGDLLYWNVKPDDETKRRLGTYYTGGPYPAAELASIPLIRLAVSPGDLYVFNGAHVHAVAPSRGLRSTAAMLLGFRDDRTVVTWT